MPTTTKTAAVLLSSALLLAGTLLWLRSPEEKPKSQNPSARSSRIAATQPPPTPSDTTVPYHVVASIPLEPPTQPGAFAKLPEEHRPAAIHSTAAQLDGWLPERRARKLDGHVVRVDCSEPPCIIELDISGGAEQDINVEAALAAKLEEISGTGTPQFVRAPGEPQRERVYVHYNPVLESDPHFAMYQASVTDRVEDARVAF